MAAVFTLNSLQADPRCMEGDQDLAGKNASLFAARSVRVRVHDLLSELKFCARKRDLQTGRRVHRNAGEAGIESNAYVAAALINIIQEPDVVSWTSLILGYANCRQGPVALDLFSRMEDECRCVPDSMTYLASLKACTSLAADGESGKKVCLQRGREIHLKVGRHMDHFVQTTLIDMYAKCGSMVDARAVFDSMQEPKVASWNALILGYADSGQGHLALDLFSRMKHESRCPPNSVTYVAALKACASVAADGDETGKKEFLERGREIHLEIGCHMNHFVQNTLIDMYAKCGSMEEARKIFERLQEPDVVSWNAVILGYADAGQGLVAMDLFSRMKHRCAPNSVTYVAALKACASVVADGDEALKQVCLQRGSEIHMEIGRHMDHFVQSTLIDMYAKCGSMIEARKVFDGIQEPDVVSWTALISGYADNGQGLVALELFSRMKDECRCAPDSVTHVAAFKACRSIGALSIGRRFHSEIRDFNARVVTGLVEFYAECGSMEEAYEVFVLHPRVRSVATWNALLTGYSRFGDVGSVFSLFEAMQEQGFRPDAVIFACMLTCCSHAGLVEKAWEYFEGMSTRYGVSRTVVHYNCMIDLLGRANKLDEAVALLQEMPCHPNAVTWRTLLGACRKWKNAEIGRLAFRSLVDLDQKIGSAYILMAETYISKRSCWNKDQAAA